MNTTRKERFIQKATRLAVKVLLFSLLLSLFLYAGVGTDSALIPDDMLDASIEPGIAQAAGSALSTIKDTTPASSARYGEWFVRDDDESLTKTYAGLTDETGSTTGAGTGTLRGHQTRSWGSNKTWSTTYYFGPTSSQATGSAATSAYADMPSGKGAVMLATEFTIPYNVSSASKMVVIIDYYLQRTSGSGDYVSGLYYAFDQNGVDNKTFSYSQTTDVNNNLGNTWATRYVNTKGTVSGRFSYVVDLTSGSGNYYLTSYFAKPLTGNEQAHKFYNTITTYVLQDSTTQYALTNRADFDVLSLTTNAGYNYSGKTLYVEPANGSSIPMGGDFTPVGTSAHPFSGTIEGNGKLISGYNTPAVQYSGLFGYISGANLKNFTVNPGTINGNATDKGAVVGYMTGSTLSGITTSGGAVWGYGYTGGIVGRAEGTSSIINCTNLGTIVYNNGTVAGTGGILGYANGTITVTGCKNYGTTSTTSANNNTTYNVYFSNADARDGWGGIVGYSNSMLTLSGCENRASLIWKQNDAGHNNFYAIGGIVGKMNNGSISSSKNFGNIYGGKLTGGIVGEVIGGATVSQCYNAGPVQTWGSGTYSYYNGEGTYVGGIAGASRGTIEYCYSIGTVTDSSGKGFAGGIAAATEGNINYCYSVATISSSVGTGVGNLLGHSPSVVNVGTSWAFFSGAVPSTSNTCELNGSTWTRGRAAVLPSSIATADIPTKVVPALGSTVYSSWEQITEYKFDGFGLTFTTNANSFVQAVNLTTSKVAGTTPIDASFVSSSASIDGTTSTSVSNQVTLSMGFSANIDNSHAGLYIDPGKAINASINAKTYDATSGAPVLGTGNAGSQARFLYYHGGKWQTTAPINAGTYSVAVEVISNGGVIGRQTGLSYTINKRELTVTYGVSDGWAAYTYNAAHQGVTFIKVDNLPTALTNAQKETVFKVISNGTDSVSLATAHSSGALQYNASNAIRVGSYSVNVTLSDTSNYTLTGLDAGSYGWTIGKRELTLTVTYENSQNLSSYKYSAGHQGVNQLQISNFPTNSGNQNIVTVETLSGSTKPSVSQKTQNPLVYSISGAVNVGNYGFVVTLKDTHNYTLKHGSTTSATHNFSWAITPKNLADSDINPNFSRPALEYTGSEKNAEYIVKWAAGSGAGNGANDSGAEITLNGNNFTATYNDVDRVNVTGQAIVLTITGKGNYTGTRTFSYTIVPYDLVAHILTTRDAFIYYGGTAFGAPSKNETYGWDMYPFVNLTDSNGYAVLDAGVTFDAQLYGIVYSAERFKLVTNLGQLNPNLITAETTLTDGEVFDSMNATTGVSSLTTITWRGTQNYTGTITVKFVVVNSDFGAVSPADRNGDGKVESEWGSVDNPYVISHWIHLLRLSEIVNQISAPINSVNGMGINRDSNVANTVSNSIAYSAYQGGQSHFVVTENITIPEYIEFFPIGGHGDDEGLYFGGIFDGSTARYANINLGNHFASLTSNYVGLFGVVKGNADGRAELIDFTVTSNGIKGGNFVGSMVGKADSYVYISVESIDNGYQNSNVINGANCVGGVVGYVGLGVEMYGEFVNNASVTGTGDYVGGVIGQLKAGAGRQGTAASERENYTFGEFEDSEGNVHKAIMVNWGEVKGINSVGGIIGGMVTNSGDYSGVQTVFNPTYVRNFGNITASNDVANISEWDFVGQYAGGFIGEVQPMTIVRLTNREGAVDVNTWSYNGNLESDSTTITALNYAGGLFGYLGEGGHQITSVFSTATVSAISFDSGAGENIGGLVGYMKGGSFKNCFVTIPGNTEEVKIDTSRVLGNKNVGGLVGWMYAGTLDTCYAQGFKYDNNVTVNKGGVVGVANTVTIKNTWALYLTADPTYQSVPANTYGKYILSFYSVNDGAMSATMDELLVFASLLDDASITVARATGGANEIKAEKGYISLGITLPEVTSNISNFDTAVQVVFYDGSGYQEAYADAFEEAANDSTLNNLFIRLNSSNDSFIIAKTGVRFGSISDYNNDREWEEKFISLYGGSYMVDVVNPVDNTGAGTYDGQLVTKYSNYTHTLISDDIGNSRETLSNLFDGDVTTKFCYSTTSQTFVIDLSTSVYVSGYRWATANDTASYTSRNPNKFVIEGSNNNSSWTTLLTESNNDWTTENFTWVHGSAFSNPGSYRYIRVTVNSSGSPLQLSEFRVGHFVNTSREITFNFKKYSEVAPRVISTQADWNAFAADVRNSGVGGLKQFVKLATSDIVVDHTNLAGRESTDNVNARNFQGTFDGDGNTITINLNGSNAASLNELGLFPQAMNATFQNLTIAGSITSTGYDIGAFVGAARGPLTFYNCTNKATVKSTGTNSHNVGGLVGTANNQNVTFIGCVNQGDITGEWNYREGRNGTPGLYTYYLIIDRGTGGILGSTGTNTGSTILIDSCRNAGTITGDAAVGGIVGACRAAAQITNCGNTGFCHATNVENGDTKHGSDCAVGGIVGAASEEGGANIYACYNSGKIVADGNKAGGIMGTDGEYTTSKRTTQIYNCYNTGDVYTGSETPLTSNGRGVQAGGIIGVGVRVDINYCYNVGKVTANGYVTHGVGSIGNAHARVGGIVGQAYGDDANNNSTISNVYNAGQIVIGYNNTTSGSVNRVAYAAGIVGCVEDDAAYGTQNVTLANAFSFEYQVYRPYHYNSSEITAQDTADTTTAFRFSGAVLRTKGCALSGTYLTTVDELTCVYDSATGVVRPKNDAVYRAFGENGKAPVLTDTYQDGTINASQLAQGLTSGGYVFVYGCLPQLAVFAVDTQDGTAITSQNYVKDKMGIYHLEKAGSENNPYVIKDGIDLMGINALSQANYNLDGKYLEFANVENNLSGDICQEINMPSTAAGDGTKAADEQNYYKFKNGRTNGYSEGKSYHLFKKGAYCSAQTVGEYMSETGATVPSVKNNYARANWKNANDYWNGSSWLAGGDLTNVNFYPIGRYYSIVHKWTDGTGQTAKKSAAFKGHIDGTYDGTNPVVISNVRIALSNVESHSYSGYPTEFINYDDKGYVINNDSDDVNVPIGLFGFVEDATIANIAVTGTIKAYGSGTVSAGVVGKALGSTSIIGVQAGTGNASLTITSYTGADAHVGGIVGMADSGASGNRLTIADSVVANATVNSHKGAVGGIVSYVVGDGISSFIDITGCHVQKATLSTADNYSIGGIIGIQGTKIIDEIAVGCALSIRDCKVGDTSKKAPATANVIIRGHHALGGIIAYTTTGATLSASFEDCYVYGDVLIEKTSATNFDSSTYFTSIGGITGAVVDDTDSFVTFRGDMEFYGTINLGGYTGVKNVGGVVGYMGTSARMEQSFVEVYGTINAAGCANSENIGGFAGISKGVCLDGAFAIAPTLTTDVSSNVGGFIGLNDGDTYITRTSLIYTSKVSWADADGDDFPDQNEITTTGAGSVVAKEKVGGFIGANNVGCELHMGAAEYKGAIYGEDGDLAYIELGSSVDGLRYIGGFLGHNAGEIFGEYCDVINTGAVGTASVPTEGYAKIACIGGVFGVNTATGEINISEDATFINNGQVGNEDHIEAKQEFVGGIIGIVLGTINNNGSMQNMGDVYGYQYVGGAIGGLVKGTISGELSNGNGVVIHATAESEALVASDEAVSTAATGSSSVKAVVNVGGVIGIIMQGATISGATLTNYGSVTSTGDSYNVSNLGGAIGLNYGIIENSEFYNYGEITAKNFAGGAIGVNDGTIRNSDFVNSATIHFTGDTALGGAVGYITNNYTTHGSTAYYPDNSAWSGYEYNDSTRNPSTVTDSYFGYESIDNSKVVVQATGVDPYAFNANDDADSAFAAQGGLGGVFGAINSDDMTASGGWSGNTFFVYGDVYGGVFKSNASNGGVYVDDATTPFTNQNFGGTVQAVGGVIGAIEVSYISIHNMLIYKSNVGGLRRVGGVVGFNGNANSTEGAGAAVDNCYNVYGNVIGTSTSVSNGNGSQINVGAITVNYEDVGGIVGYIPTDANVVTGEAYDPKTNASYWIKSYANELLQNSNPDNITETLDKASTWTEFLSYADYSNNVDQLDANGNPIHLVGEIDTWDKYFAANPGLYVQNANGDWGSYSEESVKIKYNTGTKETGYYYLFTDDSASFTDHAEGVVVDHNHTPVKLSAPYASNESLNYWLIIVGSAKRAQVDGTYYDEYESDFVHENVGGAVKAGYIYSTAYASTKNGFYLYVKDQGNATTLNGEGDKIYISSDANNAGNIMIFYKEVVAYNNFVYNGYERYAQLVDVNFSEDQPTEGVGEENINNYFGKYYYTFNGTVPGEDGIGINRATNAGSHDIKAIIWTVDSKGKPITLGSVDSTIDGADQYKWSIKKRNIEVDFDTQSPHIVDTKNNEDPADAFRFDNTFSHYIKFTVSNIAIDVDEDVSSGEKIMAIINKIVTPKYSFNGGSESSLVDLKEGSVVPEIQVPQNSEVANVSFYAVGANSTSGSKNDTDNCYVYDTDEYKNVGSVKLYSATYIVYFKKAGAHKVSVTATDTNHRASSSDNKTVTVDKRELKLEVNTSENSWKTNYIFDGGKNWQGVTSVVISNFIAGTLDDKTDYVTTTGSTTGLSNGNGNKNAGDDIVVDTSANTITVNFYANDAATYNAVVELAALFKDSYYFVFKGTEIGTLSSGAEPSKWNVGWTINPYTIVAQADGISGGTYVYDGTIHAIKIASGDDSITGGVDGAPEKVEVSIDVNMTDSVGNSISQACNVGTYTATIDAASGVAGAGKVIAESSSKSSASIKNYVIDFSLKEGSNLTATITITPCPIEVNWKDVFNNKAGNGYVYDGNTNGPVIGSLTVGGESKTFSNGKAEGVTKNESISLSVGYTVEKNASNNVTAYTKDFKVTGTNEVGDALASNYTFVGGAGYDEGEDRVEKTFSRAKSIISVTVTIPNGGIPDKVFDNTIAVGSINYDYNVVSSNSSKTCSITSRSLTGTFSDANVGSNKTVNLTFSASLSDTTNFEWASTKYTISGDKTATITARPLYIQLNNGANGSIYKTYDNSTLYASVTSDSGDEKQSTGIQWRTGRGILVSNFCTSDITVTASFLEVDQKNRSDFNAYVNDIYVDASGQYVIGGTNATDTFYKMLRFALSGEGSTNYYIAEISIDKGKNVLKSNADTSLKTLDLVDTAEDNISIVIKKASVKVNYSNTSQSYANADNTYNTNWNEVTGQISTSKYKNLATVAMNNGWMHDENGDAAVYKKYTRIAGSATSPRLGATLTSADGKHLCLTLRNQPTLIIGYFVEKKGGYEIGSMAGLLIASEYFKNNFNSSDEKGYDYIQTEIPFSKDDIISGHSSLHLKVPESVYSQIANDEITTWEQLLAAVPEYDPRGYTHENVEYEGANYYLSLLDDLDDVTDEYLKAALQSQLDSFEFVYELINASGEAVESETLHLVWWVPVEVKDTRSYNSFILVDNIDAILTDADIDMLTGAFGSNYGVGKTYLPNVVFAEAGSVVIFNGPIFDYSTDKDGNKVGFNGIFDGDGYSIDHLTITYVVTETSHNNVGMFAEVSGEGSQVTKVNLRNLSIQVIDTTASAKVINVGGVAGKFAAYTENQIMEDVTVHGTISVKSTLGTVHAGGIIGCDTTGYVNASVSKVIDGAIVVATVRAEGAVAVAGGIIGITEVTTLNDVVSLSEVYAKGGTAYAGGFVGMGKFMNNSVSSTNHVDGKDFVARSSEGKTSAYLDSVFTITADGTYTRIAGGVSYDTLYDGSSTAYVDGIYLNAIERKYGTYDMVSEKNAIAGENTTGSMRLRDIVDTYVLGYELSAYTSGTGESAIATYRKSTTSKYVGEANGTTAKPINIAYQQHLNLIRMFNYMNFTLNRNVTMYTGYELRVIDEAFTGTIEANGHEVNVRSSESNKDFEDDLDDTTYPQFFAYQDVNFTWLKKD